MAAPNPQINSPIEDALQAETMLIKGMTCGACASRVEKVVAEVDGVADVNVNLATERMQVQFDTARVDPRQVRDAVRGAGYAVEEIEATRDILLPIEGMTCAACAARIESVVAGLDGGRSVAVNLLDENARIRYAPAVTRLADIRQAITATGYTPLDIIESSSEDRDRESLRETALH